MSKRIHDLDLPLQNWTAHTASQNWKRTTHPFVVLTRLSYSVELIPQTVKGFRGQKEILVDHLNGMFSMQCHSTSIGKAVPTVRRAQITPHIAGLATIVVMN